MSTYPATVMISYRYRESGVHPREIVKQSLHSQKCTASSSSGLKQFLFLRHVARSGSPRPSLFASTRMDCCPGKEKRDSAKEGNEQRGEECTKRKMKCS